MQNKSIAKCAPETLEVATKQNANDHTKTPCSKDSQFRNRARKYTLSRRPCDETPLKSPASLSNGGSPTAKGNLFFRHAGMLPGPFLDIYT
jgi:hypothetical protein